MERLSVIVTNGGYRLYDDPNGELVLLKEAQEAIAETKRVNGALIRDLYKQISELNDRYDNHLKMVCR